MKRKAIFTLAVGLGLAAALGLLVGLTLAKGGVQVPALADTAPTVVSYQGEVLVDGKPYTGTGYFKFAVVNLAGNSTHWSNDGTSANGLEPSNAVPLAVQDGLFAVLLGNTTLPNMTQPLTATVFTDKGRRLHVWFDTDGAGAFTDLGLTVVAAVPYALNAETLDGLDSDAFAGVIHFHSWNAIINPPNAYTPTAHTHLGSDVTSPVAAAQSAPWSGLTGVPAGFADSVDNEGGHYNHVIVVAKSGGDYTTIGAALASITDNSAASRYLVWVGPGTYTETVTMKQYVDIEGAGELLTTLSYTGSAWVNTGTVAGANNAELRFLTARNTGGDNYAIAIYNFSASPRLTHVTASASGAIRTTYGVYNESSSPAMVNVTASASGGEDARGVFNSTSSAPMMVDMTASASGALSNTYGVFNSTSSPTMTRVTASASGANDNEAVYNYLSAPTMVDVTASASGGDRSYGVYNWSSSPMMTRVTASASGAITYAYGVRNTSSSPTMMDVIASALGAVYNYGMRNFSSSPTIRNSTLSASGGSESYGLYNAASSDTYTVTVDSCQITGGTNSVSNDNDGGNNYTTYVGASLLAGGVVTGSGTITCVYAYNGTYAALDASCQ